jgi:hypothetical protein
MKYYILIEIIQYVTQHCQWKMKVICIYIVEDKIPKYIVFIKEVPILEQMFTFS